MAITLNGTTGITTADIEATTLTVNTGYGSNATAYGVRAWLNLDGSGPTINGSGGVSSITDRGLGKWSINLTNTMPDTNYVVTGTTPSNGNFVTNDAQFTKTTSQASIFTFNYAGGSVDYNPVNVVIIR